MTDECRPMGFKEIAALLGVRERTVNMWKWESKLPPADYTVHGMDAWDRDTILTWAGETGRCRTTALRSAYKRLTGQTAAPAPAGGRPPKATAGKVK